MEGINWNDVECVLKQVHRGITSAGRHATVQPWQRWWRYWTLPAEPKNAASKGGIFEERDGFERKRIRGRLGLGWSVLKRWRTSRIADFWTQLGMLDAFNWSAPETLECIHFPSSCTHEINFHCDIGGEFDLLHQQCWFNINLSFWNFFLLRYALQSRVYTNN